MSSDLILLALIVLVPPILMYFGGINGATVFFSLCLGYVLYTFDSQNVDSLAQNAKYHPHLNNGTFAILIGLVLLIGPALVTMVAQLKSVGGKHKYLNIVPSLFVGLFAALITVPALPSAMSEKIINSSSFNKMVHYQALIVGIGAAISLIFFWLNSRHAKEGKKSKHAK